MCEPRRPGLDLVEALTPSARSGAARSSASAARTAVFSGASRAPAPQVRPWTCAVPHDFCAARDAPEGRSRGLMPENNSTERRSMLECTVRCSANMDLMRVNSVLLFFSSDPQVSRPESVRVDSRAVFNSKLARRFHSAFGESLIASAHLMHRSP